MKKEKHEMREQSTGMNQVIFQSCLDQGNERVGRKIIQKERNKHTCYSIFWFHNLAQAMSFCIAVFWMSRVSNAIHSFSGIWYRLHSYRHGCGSTRLNRRSDK